MSQGPRSLNEVEVVDRVAWRIGRIPGRSAVFAPGEIVRCVGPKALSRGATVPCGWPMGSANERSTVIVRVKHPKRAPMPHLGKDPVCPDCHTSLEEFVLGADAPRLEATG